MDGRNWNWNCNWNWNNAGDVSPFLLFESTGDSEANSDLNMTSLSAGDNNMEVTYAADDAQSCCSNLSDSLRDYNHHDQDQEYAQCPKKKDQEYAKCPKKKCKKKDHAECSKKKDHAQCSKKKEQEYANYDGYNPNYRDYNDDDDDEDDGAIDQYWTCGKMGFAVSRQKQKKNVDSTVEPAKEEEKDKLFWDTCLGS